jgi:hypothetical protein
MNTAERDALIARAKSLAAPAASCASAGISAGHLLREASPELLRALVNVLAAAADPVRLRAVTRAPGGVVVLPADRARVLRRAHAEFTRLVRAGLPVPFALRAVDGEYRADVRRRRKTAAAREGQARAA